MAGVNGSLKEKGAQAFSLAFWARQLQDISFVRSALFVCFLLSVATFPLGQAFRVGGPLACLPFLVALYWFNWKRSTLRLIPVRWFCLLFIVSVCAQILFSQWIAVSWAIVRPNIFRGLVMFLAAMEAVRSEKELRWLTYVFAGVFFYEGLDGVWQAATGRDFIHNKAVMDGGRLTGSLGTYRVGNYMAIIALPAFGLCLLLPKKNKIVFFIAVSVIFFPGVFLWMGSRTRIGYLGLLLGCYFLWLFIWTRFSWKKLLLPPAIGIVATAFTEVFFVGYRSLFKDPRIKIWSKAISVGLENFWFGTGSGTFTQAVAEDKAFLDAFPVDLGHPHNIYVQFFVDGGAVGLVCFVFFVLGVTFWTWRRVRRGVFLERNGIIEGRRWRLASFFWGGWISYLGTGLGGHDFYRAWWFAIAAIILGSLFGACWQGEERNGSDGRLC